MAATCQHIERGTDFGRTGDQVTNSYCSAPIPRLDEGPCTAEVAGVGECLAPRDYWRHGQTVVGRRNHAYLGPLASECTNRHPVAVPSEAERRG